MDRLAAEVGKREEVDRKVTQLQQELNKKAEELQAIKADMSAQKRAMEKSLKDAKATQDQHKALRADVWTVAKAVLHECSLLLFLLSLYLGKGPIRDF